MRELSRTVANDPGGGGSGSVGYMETQKFTYLGGFPVSQTDKETWVGEIDDKFLVPQNGSLVKLTLRSSSARSAGTLSAKLTINGSKITQTNLDAQLNGTTVNDVIKEVAKDTAGFILAKGDKIGVLLTSSGDWAPVDSNIEIEVSFILDS